MEEAVKKILSRHRLRVTGCRTETLALFLEKNYALSNADIEQAIGHHYNRITIYRTLRSFLKNGLLHKVLDDSGNLKYAVCSEEHCSEGKHSHRHVHFKCRNCGQTNCLENLEIPNIALPPGYLMQEANLLIQGVCKACNP